MVDINVLTNKVIIDDCLRVLPDVPDESIDFVCTDPPFLVRYKSSDMRSYPNDDPQRPFWLKPFARQSYRVLKPDAFMVCFYGFFQVEKFMWAWKDAGFRPVGHFTFIKNYRSNRHPRSVAFSHENAYLLAKGRPSPREVLSDVREFRYTGNQLHPSEKHPVMLEPLIKAFSPEKGIVLDPFCGSGSTLAAANNTGRRYIGIELVEQYATAARERLERERSNDKPTQPNYGRRPIHNPTV